MNGRWLPMATLVLAMQVAVVQASASLRSEIGSVSAMFIHNDSRNDASLEALASTLQTHYGLTADRLARVKQQDAKGDRIGAALFESIRAMGPFDTLVVVVSLELHEDGRVLKTVDFDTAQPWTGLPAETLRKLAAVTRKGTLVLVMPDCPGGSAETAAQSSNPMAGGTDSESARATISFCARDTAETNSFLTRLRATLETVARAPTTRAPWQGSSELGLVSVAGVAEHLTKESESGQVFVEYGSSGGGWLRIFVAKGQMPQVAAMLDELRNAGSVDTVRPILRNIVRRASSPDTSEELDTLAAGLTEFALGKERDLPSRTLAVQALGDLPKAVGQPALEGIFRRADDSTIKTAALRKFDVAPGNLETMLEALGDKDPQVQLSAIHALGAIQDPRSVESFYWLLKESPDSAVRAAAARAAGSVSSGSVARSMLKGAATDVSADVRLEAVAALGRARPASDVAELLAAALDDSDARVRESAAFAVSQHWPAVASHSASQLADRLLTLVRSDPSEGVRAGALWSLTKGNRPELNSQLASLLSDTCSRELRMAAVEASARLANPDSAALLLQVSDDAKVDLRLRVAAVRALGRLDSSEAAEGLLRFSASKNLDIATAATTALQNSRAPAPQALALVKDDDTPRAQRLNAIDQLARSTDPSAAQELLKLLHDDDPILRNRAAVALRAHADASTLDTLDSMVTDPKRDLSTRVAAVQVLAGRRSEAINARLTQHLSGDIEKTPPELVAALTRAVAWDLAGKRPPMETLLKLAMSSTPIVRVATTDSLRLVNNRVTREKLAAMSRDDGDAAVRDAAAEALRNAKLVTTADSGTKVDEQFDFDAPLKGQRSWHVDVFWCEGDRGRRDIAKRHTADVVAFAPSLRERGEAITRIRLRPLSEDINYIPGYRVVQNEIRYENTDANERYVAGLLRERLGNDFALRSVRNPTPTYVSIFVCDAGKSQ